MRADVFMIFLGPDVDVFSVLLFCNVINIFTYLVSLLRTYSRSGHKADHLLLYSVCSGKHD